jgi:hypothetical protein
MNKYDFGHILVPVQIYPDRRLTGEPLGDGRIGQRLSLKGLGGKGSLYSWS